MNKLLITGTLLLVLSSAGCNTNNNLGSNSNDSTDKGVAVYLTGETFREKVYNYEESREWKYLGTKPAIIDFYADWCAPCRQLSPVLEEVARDYGESLRQAIDEILLNK